MCEITLTQNKHSCLHCASKTSCLLSCVKTCDTRHCTQLTFNSGIYLPGQVPHPSCLAHQLWGAGVWVRTWDACSRMQSHLIFIYMGHQQYKEANSSHCQRQTTWLFTTINMIRIWALRIWALRCLIPCVPSPSMLPPNYMYLTTHFQRCHGYTFQCLIACRTSYLLCAFSCSHRTIHNLFVFIFASSH